MRRVGRRAVVAMALGLVAAAGSLPAQGAPPRATVRSDSLIFIVGDRIDALGTLALLTRQVGDSAPMLVDIARSAITPQLVDAVLRSANRHNVQRADSAKPLHVAITRKTTLRPVAPADKARIDAIVARLRKAPKRFVPGSGMQHAVAVALRAGPQG